MFSELTQVVGLHESVEIIYVVDGFQAAIYEQDGQDKVLQAWGETMQDALLALDKACVGQQIGFRKRQARKVQGQ